MTDKRKALLALTLLVPAPSLGVVFGMMLFPDSLVGTLLFGFTKVWLFGLPVVWLLLVDRAPFSFSPPKLGGFGMGILSGILISMFILGVYLLVGDTLIDKQAFAQKLTAIGLGSPLKYTAAALYWIMINSVLEEYVWRWFCVTQCERLMPKPAAVAVSALFFTLHHVVATSVYLGPIAVSLCGLGVFVGGAIWSLMYIKFRSIWPGYVSHAIVDLCIFGIGAALLLGSS